jgi:acyl-CoA synthetase (AMP-forming)/AMP-acid ligase II
MMAFLACLKAGVVAVPVFPPNPARKDTLLMFSRITESSGAQFALTSTEYNHMKKLAGVKDMVAKFSNRGNTTATWPENLEWIITDTTTKSTSTKTLPTPSKSDIAFLQYTSGSTSEPKGVMITHGNLAHNLASITNELQAKDDTIVVSWLVGSPMHDACIENIGPLTWRLMVYSTNTSHPLYPLSFSPNTTIWD